MIKHDLIHIDSCDAIRLAGADQYVRELLGKCQGPTAGSKILRPLIERPRSNSHAIISAIGGGVSTCPNSSERSAGRRAKDLGSEARLTRLDFLAVTAFPPKSPMMDRNPLPMLACPLTLIHAPMARPSPICTGRSLVLGRLPGWCEAGCTMLSTEP